MKKLQVFIKDLKKTIQKNTKYLNGKIECTYIQCFLNYLPCKFNLKMLNVGGNTG